MLTRTNVLNKAIDECIKELYSLVQPHVEWEDFRKECKIYSNKYKTWGQFIHLYFKIKEETLTEEELKVYSTFPVKDWEGKSIEECIGPKPFEFYYLPREVLSEIINSYVYAYKIDSHQELLDTIQILKDYCNNPIIEKYIKRKDGNPEYKGYEYPDNLEKEIQHIIKKDYPDINELELSSECISKFFKFLDMAGKFYVWNGDLSTFYTSIYFGPSPSSNKEMVIKNWKIYRKQDIKIDESKYKEDNDYD